MTANQRLPVTVIVATKNEERNLPDCLRSITFAEQVLIVDSQSQDSTVNLARQAGAEVHQFHYQGDWPKKRNWALNSLPIRNDWILILDADERVSPSLAAEMKTAILSSDIDGYYLKWRFMFLGRWMKHSWSHGWMLRLFRHGRASYEDLGMRGQGGWDAEVHENIVCRGHCERLQNVLDHDSNENLSFWIRKQNEFSDWNAARRLDQLQDPFPGFQLLFSPDPVKRRKILKAVFIRLPAKPLLMFVYLYFIKAGFLDGIEGFYFCRLRAIHEFNIGAKVFERQQVRQKQPNSDRDS